MAWPRLCNGNTWKMVIMAWGWIMPAITPCTTRASTSRPKLLLTPPTSEARMKIAMASRKARREPNRATAQALSSMPTVMAARKPVAIQCTWSCSSRYSAMMVGTATLIMVDASTTDRVPSITVTVAYHR